MCVCPDGEDVWVCRIVVVALIRLNICIHIIMLCRRKLIVSHLVYDCGYFYYRGCISFGGVRGNMTWHLDQKITVGFPRKSGHFRFWFHVTVPLLAKSLKRFCTVIVCGNMSRWQDYNQWSLKPYEHLRTMKM